MPETLSDLSGLSGRRAVVVGGAYGIGRAVVRLLAAEGTAVVVVDRDGERIRAIVNELEAGPGGAGLIADVGTPGGARAAIAEADARLGGLDMLINIVGGGRSVSGVDLNSDIQREVLALNYLHHVDCATEFARLCISRTRPGTITAVSSLAGSVPFPRQAAYGAAKAALESFIAAMAIEWAQYGIRVNAVAPGVVRTDRNPHEDVGEQLARAIPLGRLADQNDVAQAVLYLASDLSSYVTGQTLLLDGGASRYTKLWPDMPASSSDTLPG